MAHIVAQASFGRYDSEVKAALSLVLALATAWLVNRSLLAYGRTIAARVAGGELSPVADTRLRFLRRVVDAVIVLVGVATALSQFTGARAAGRHRPGLERDRGRHRRLRRAADDRQRRSRA
jgi:hypothetical protein